MHVALENETDTLELARSPEIEQEAVSKTAGQSSPLGATVRANGVNFSVYSRNASSIELLFFERKDDGKPERVIAIDPVTNRTYHYCMYSYRKLWRGRSMPIASREHSIQPRDCDLIPIRYCWTHTAAALLFPETTVVARLVKKAIMQPQP